jgi:type 1 glutamine amidotransferase
MDGGGGHPVIQRNRLTEIDQLMKRGVGLACAHYAVEVPKEKGGPDLTNWIGGYYETGYSINPHWDATFAKLPEHPTTHGVKPFKINDEWYYNIRFPENANNVQPLLSATPPDQSRGTPAAKEHAGREEVVAWAVERPDGGRGFGFTGGHNHENWGNDDFRKFVLNALLWTAKAEVPNGGVVSKVTAEELTQNLDQKKK